jgi:uncharacterized protein (DUF2236 family)
MPVTSPLTHLRNAAGNTLRELLTPAGYVPAAGPSLSRPGSAPAADPGLFGPGSVTWRVHSHMSSLVGGFRSLLLQTLHPLAMAGVAQHSSFRTDPLGRLQRTAGFVAITTYGTTAEAEAAIDKVRRVHERVRGVAPDGRPYSANDPDLLAWVHHVEVQSFLVAYQRIGPGLSAGEADRYVAEMALLGERLGVKEPVTTAAGLHEWVGKHPERQVTPSAREAVRFMLAPPLPLPARAPYTVLLAGAVSLIPFRTRTQLGLWWPGPIGGRLACEPAARAMAAALAWAMGPSVALAKAEARLSLANLSGSELSDAALS